MKKVILTKDEWESWFMLHRDHRSWRPKYPYCKICSDLRSRNPKKWEVKFLKIGEEVYKVEYGNHKYALYHVKCMDDPNNPMHIQMKVEAIKKMDVDRWDGFKNYYELLMKQKLTRSEIVHKIVERYHVGVSTAYRRLKNLTCD